MTEKPATMAKAKRKTQSPQRSPLARVFHDRTSSGLRVVTIEMAHLHAASIAIYAKIGSRYESSRDSGLSHFVEHMLFRGCARYPTSYDLNWAIESLGGTLNAETGRDYSMYQVSLSPDCVAEGISILGEIFRAPKFDEIDREREMILEELLEDYSPRGALIHLGDLTQRELYPLHPLGASIAGPKENVQRFSVRDVKRHFARAYGLDNLVFCAAGNCDRKSVLRAVERAFSDLPVGREVTATRPPIPAPKLKPRIVHVDHEASQTSIAVAFHGLAEDHPDYAAQQMLGRVLDDGMSTRLHYTLCDRMGLAYSVGAGLDTYVDAANFFVDGACAHAKAPKLLREMFKLVAALGSETIRPEELEKARRRIRFDLEAAFDEPDALGGTHAGNLLLGSTISPEERIRRALSVTAADLARAAQTIFQPHRMVVVTVGGTPAKIVRAIENSADEFSGASAK